MKKINLLLIGTILLSVQAFAQHDLKKVEGSGLHTSDVVYVNEQGEYFAKVFYIAFGKHITEDIQQAKDIRSFNIRAEFAALKGIYSELERNHGLQQMERLYPEATPNDTIRYSKKGKRVVVSDLSKIYRLIFEDKKALKSIRENFTVPDVRYVEQPPIYYVTSNSPNDPYFDNQWTHKILESEKVFDITKGDPDIVIGISDAWTTDNSAGVHEDLDGRIIAYEHGMWVPGQTAGSSHGPRIALIAAATNNNNKGIASLGGNMKIVTSGEAVGSNGVIPGLPYLRDICDNPQDPIGCEEFPDVVNMSWNGLYNTFTLDVLQDLLNMGVILVTAAGNFGDPPRITYPSGYIFDNDAQVISVTATQLTDNPGAIDVTEPFNPFQYQERFAFRDDFSTIFNYGLSNDPISNPDSAFIDVAAPSRRIFTAKGETATNDYHAFWGATSEAAPLVTSVIAMMLSVNPDLKGDPQGVYDIITSTTEYNNIEVPPGAVTNTLPDGRKYNKYIGYGRVNAYRAVLAAVPKITADVTSNETWSGYVHLENTIRVENNSTLTIEPGTTVLLDEGVNLSIRSGLGGKLIAEGTEEEPIRFLRADPNEAWGSVYLNSSAGNSIKWALFDGGSTNLTIASQNNTIEHSTFRNATFRNIDSWHNQDGSGNSNAILSHVLIEDGATVGLVAQYIDLDISNTTIQNNTQAGLYITSATVFPFHHNKITGNGGTTRDGIEVMSSGSLTMQENISFTGKGFNKVSGNGDDQISNYGTLTVGSCLAMMGEPPDAGHNHVSGPFSGSQYLVNNFSSTSVHICQNWWGQSSIQTSMFNGPVYGTDYYLTSDPTLSQNPGSGGQVPSKALPDMQTDDREIMVETYDYYELQLEAAENGQQVRDRLNNLYRVAGLARKVAPELDERFLQFTQDAARGIKTIYSSEGQNQTLQNLSRILYANSLQRNGDYEMAAKWLNSTDAELFGSHDRHHWQHLKMDVQRYHGYYEDALMLLESLYAFREADGADMDKLKAHYSVIEDDLIARIEAGESLASGQVKQVNDSDGIEEIRLASNYPNPFNPVTVISYQLPVNSCRCLNMVDAFS